MGTPDPQMPDPTTKVYVPLIPHYLTIAMGKGPASLIDLCLGLDNPHEIALQDFTDFHAVNTKFFLINDQDIARITAFLTAVSRFCENLKEGYYRQVQESHQEIQNYRRTSYHQNQIIADQTQQLNIQIQTITNHEEEIEKLKEEVLRLEHQIADHHST